MRESGTTGTARASRHPAPPGAPGCRGDLRRADAGDKIPRKGGPGITRSDLPVINKTDLAPLAGANLGVMKRDAQKMRGERSFRFTNLKAQEGIDAVVDFALTAGGFADAAMTET